MNKEDFIKLINDLFQDLDIVELYSIKIMCNDKIKIEYQPSFFVGCKCTETLKRKSQEDKND